MNNLTAKWDAGPPDTGAYGRAISKGPVRRNAAKINQHIFNIQLNLFRSETEPVGAHSCLEKTVPWTSLCPLNYILASLGCLK